MQTHFILSGTVSEQESQEELFLHGEARAKARALRPSGLVRVFMYRELTRRVIIVIVTVNVEDVEGSLAETQVWLTTLLEDHGGRACSRIKQRLATLRKIAQQEAKQLQAATMSRSEEKEALPKTKTAISCCSHGLSETSYLQLSRSVLSLRTGSAKSEAAIVITGSAAQSYLGSLCTERDCTHTHTHFSVFIKFLESLWSCTSLHSVDSFL